MPITFRSPGPWAWALAAVIAMNLWVGLRLDALIQDSEYGELTILDQRIRDFPGERVEVLVIGNSHALAGLRPPDLAQAWGLPPDAVFSFAMAGASPQEAALLIQKYRARFPRLRLVLSSVDASWLSVYWLHRVRRLTAMRPVERAIFAAPFQREERLRAVVGSLLPLLDFAPTIRAAAVEHPLFTARALVRPVPMLHPALLEHANHPFRWGYPPTWEVRSPRSVEAARIKARLPAELAKRAEGLRFEADQAAVSLDRLGALAASLAPVRLALVEMPFVPAFDAAAERRQPGYARLWRAALAAHPVAGRLPVIAVPQVPAAEFYDADHVSLAGAARLAAHVAARLSPAGEPRETASR